ncbi:MAG: TatD family hydrolase [Myxococcota bacterium]
MGLFDVHAHLTSPRLQPDEAEIVQRARDAGLTTILSNGLNPADNVATAALASRHDIVRPCFGLYPVDAVLPEMLELGVEYHREDEAVWPAEEAVQWVADHVDDAFAVGEVGLDGYWVPQELWERQEWAFRALIRIAIEADKALIIHTRKRERRALEILQEEGATKVDWHCFSSRVKLGRRIAEHGHWLSIPANVRVSENFVRLVETLPKNKILVETDCPYLAPTRGDRNEPVNVVGTVAFMAERWGWAESEVLEQLEQNFEALFGVRP